MEKAFDCLCIAVILIGLASVIGGFNQARTNARITATNARITALEERVKTNDECILLLADNNAIMLGMLTGEVTP